ncbi:PadR family transcriptional regulator [Hydrogenoanaerobacterium sp.]|uniref:PadR family transcriptional regulator n=1 Tax=Hydrogenoanaerobacterium sp. TaxID=2953763 RepID=UPI00289904B0|nr:PadR family transcriptional regulator [Hydrogenoanaerobacterium sp.]
MEKEEILSGLIMELRRGTIVLCVLSQLQEPMYGYNLVNVLSGKGIAVEANTLYPLLRRLEAQGLLKSTWETSGAKPRKYYSTTAMGDEIFANLKKHWDSSVENMNTLWEDDSSEQ